jgi:hypothetical protein
MLEECDLCHDLYPIDGIVFTGRQCLCRACYNPDGRIAQELEQALDKRQVGGANPSATTSMKKAFLLSCWYDYYCQGTEAGFGYFLVYAHSFEDACNKLRQTLENVRDITNCTIE